MGASAKPLVRQSVPIRRRAEAAMRDYDACMEAVQHETSDDPVEVMLRRSDELREAPLHLLDGAEFDSLPLRTC